ncbi:unnamed protein product [Aspergillus oryzae]|uniref:Unnamed protein product n=2 Tax=Aspergillus oryzae TaxID=5062 RepID=A0AAN4YT94_ASPOZ|nr:unnamed protein product [Aspergillus oryzae]GMF95580.1 unnamed protein product [Aspergillus oryzae]GMG09251.1 unnamed protein product [Aspergillus oryzae]GMG34751.1 unnamed protein product [Aspergillus oryzae]GMG53235.1 unnamed protein product [Aspergillus oryzae var. brunneus]
MEDTNPLVRALALRTISYVHVREFVEATVQPVKRLMGDMDPYVRKTSAFCVAKLYEHDRKMVESSDLIDRLNHMLKDENPTVVSSVLASLNDIWGRSETISLTIDYTSASKLVSILPDCSDDQAGIDIHVNDEGKHLSRVGRIERSAAKECIDTLLELVNAKIPYIVQEATVVIRNIFRKYPNQYESIIGRIIQNIDELDEPEAKAAIIWIIGQYADRIENSDGLLQDYLATFHDETVEVQLALLTATVKFFIQRPTKGQQLVPQVLKWCTEETDDPDLRDRGYMYWRLLSTDPATARQVVMGQKPPISAESEKLDSRTLEELCLNVGTLATVYLKPVQQVFRSARTRRLQYSPALQKPRNDDGSNAWQYPVSPSSATPVTPTSAANGAAPAPGDMNAAVNAADSYFNSVGTQQMAALDLGGRGDGIGGGGAPQTQYIVSQNQQQVYQPQLAGGAATGELLLL